MLQCKNAKTANNSKNRSCVMHAPVCACVGRDPILADTEAAKAEPQSSGAAGSSGRRAVSSRLAVGVAAAQR